MYAVLEDSLQTDNSEDTIQTTRQLENSWQAIWMTAYKQQSYS